MKLTLIITTYNWPESLLLVIESVKKQTILPNEVIIADDGSTIDTKKVISHFIENSNLNIIHSWQEDLGFRVARSRNNAILKSSGSYIVLIDGDMILHKDFIKDHLACAEAGYFVQGHRTLISKKQTKKALKENSASFTFFCPCLKNRKNCIHSIMLSKLFSNKRNNLKGIKSCNLAFFRKDFFDINGFNNEFEGWGREDSEFIVRLVNRGINRKNIRFKMIQ